MTWLSWRQLRLPALAVYAAVAGAVLVLVVTERGLPAPGAAVYDQLTRTGVWLYFAGLVLLALAPALVGAFWGAPLVARELENGTHRLVWQSVTRTRWLAARMGWTVLTAAGAVGALSWAVTWWSGRLDGAASSTSGALPGRLTPVAFAMRGVAPIGYTVFAVVLGVAVGAVLRRSVPAMAVTLALFATVQVLVPLFVRGHLLEPVQQTVTVTRANLDSIGTYGNDAALQLRASTGHRGDWVLTNETVDAAGRPAALPVSVVACFPGPPPPGQPRQEQVGPDPIDQCLSQLAAAGYRQRLVFQPADRFWPLQFAEAGAYLAASALLVSCCFWRVRRLS